MSAIGMRHLVFAPITSHTSGAAITYGTGASIDHAVRGQVTLNWSEGTDYANDIIDDYYKRCTGADIEVESTVWPDAIMAMLGLEQETAQGSKIYKTMVDAETEVGFGFVQVLRENGANIYRGWWVHKVMFTPGDVEANTMEEDIEWTHVSLTGKAKTCYLDTDEPQVMNRQDFATEAAAEAWLDGLANL